MAKFTADSRAQRIKQLIARLEAGKDIQARDLALVLTTAQLDSSDNTRRANYTRRVCSTSKR